MGQNMISSLFWFLLKGHSSIKTWHDINKMALKAARPPFAEAPFGSFSLSSPAERDMLLHTPQHWYIFSSLCWATDGPESSQSDKHKAVSAASPEHLFSSVEIKQSDDRWMQTLRKTLAHVHKSDWPVQCHYTWQICILKTQSLFGEWQNDLPLSVFGVATFSVFLRSCSAINSGECCCLSYFMCHRLGGGECLLHI